MVETMKIDKKAANLAREIWRLRGKCENCGRSAPQYQMHGAHIIGVGTARRIASDLRNGFCLCSICHRYFGDHPVEFTEFIMKSWAGKYYKTLKRLSQPHSGPKIDWLDRMDFLKEIKRAMLAGEMTIEQARSYELDDY